MTARCCANCGNWDTDPSESFWGYCLHPDIPFSEIRRGAYDKQGKPVKPPYEVLEEQMTGYRDWCPGHDPYPGADYLPLTLWQFARRNQMDLQNLEQHTDPFDDRWQILDF